MTLRCTWCGRWACIERDRRWFCLSCYFRLWKTDEFRKETTTTCAPTPNPD